jgi:hypothetical protein
MDDSEDESEPHARGFTPGVSLDKRVRSCSKTIVKARFERLSPEARAQLLNTEANRKVHEYVWRGTFLHICMR